MMDCCWVLLVGGAVIARRLHLVPLADPLAHAPDLGPLLRGLGGPAAVEARSAPRLRAVLQARCLGPDGLPLRVTDARDLAVFGVKPADLPGEQIYLDYVPRDDDQALRAALAEAARERRMLLVVGGSAAGKRSAVRRGVAGVAMTRPLTRPPVRSDLLASDRERVPTAQPSIRSG